MSERLLRPVGAAPRGGARNGHRRRHLARSVLAAALLTPLAACNPFEDEATVDARRVEPCAGGQVVDLGQPGTRDRWATFEVERGPVWVGVVGWDPGMLDPTPYRSVIDVGSADRPPEPDRNGNIASEVTDVVVVEGRWSPLDVGTGRYWLLASSIADTVRLKACGRSRIGAVTPAGRRDEPAPQSAPTSRSRVDRSSSASGSTRSPVRT